MLGKLFKHEFKETAKRLIPLNCILIVFTLLGCIFLGTNLFQQSSLALLSVSCTILYVLSIFALFVITGVYLTIRFYKTMYSNQGYLTHTLPVSTGSILNTKILVSVFWVCIATIVTILSVFALVRVAAGVSWESMDLSHMKYVFATAFGLSVPEVFFYIGMTLILSCFSVVLMVCASLSIGQLFSQHRILGSVAAFVAIYMVQQMVGTVIIFILGMQSSIFDFEGRTETAAAFPGFYRGMFGASLIELAFFSIVFYGVSYYLTKKKLNLE